MKKQRGSLTVEAAVTLPIFLFVILSIIFLIKTAYVHEIIQHAIHESANEISGYSYILAASGVKEFDDTIKDKTKERGALFENSLDDVVEAYEAIGNMKASVDGLIKNTKDGDSDIGGNVSDVKKTYEEFNEKINAALESGAEMFEGTDGIYSMLFSMGGLVYNDAKSVALQNMSKLLVRKYISPNNPSDINRKLKGLNIDGGLNGLDFSQSQFFKNGDDIDIIVRYKLNLVLPINIFPEIYIIQRATVRGWLDGYGNIASSETGDTKVDEPDIWSWGNMPRGEYVKRELGKNLPKNFKTIDIFQDGEAVSIVSKDTRAESYKNISALKSSIRSDLNKLVNFDGYKLQGVEVKPEDITRRKLVLVIPTGEYTQERKNLIEELKGEYKEKGVTIEVKEFK